MTSRPKLSVLVVHDNRAGHLNPSLGVYDALSEAYETQLVKLERPSIKKWQISLLKKISYYPSLFLFFSDLFFGSSQPKQQYDCIICSGMPNLLFSIYLSKKMSIPLFYAGDLRKVNSALVTCTITALKQNILGDQIVLATPPVKKVFSDLQNIPAQQNQALLILGGITDEHPFKYDDFSTIIQNFITLCEKHQLNGAITTSRRTPDLSTEWNKVTSLPFISLHLVDDKHALPISELMKQANYIFVTEDSTSMIAEAIQSGRFISSLYQKNSQLEALNEKYEHEHFMIRQLLNQTYVLPNQKNALGLAFKQPLIEAFQRHLGF